MVAALREQGRIVAEKRPYVHSVGHCSRCGTTVEPRLSLQWFVRVEPLAKAAGDAVRDGRVAIHPPEMEARYFAWVDDMHDWCISRQLWWGHRIPVWYGPDGEVVCVGPDEQPPAGEGWTQDADVLDTWFSSGLWPFSTLGWPDETADLRRFYPTSVLVTGYDILFFWVARMMMFGLYAMDGRQPFDVVALHGMVRDKYGKKMSKSFGNAVDPLDWMDAYGVGRAALHARPRRQPRHRRADRRGVGAGQPQLLQQAVERGPVRADQRRDRGRAAAAGRGAVRPSTAGSCPGSRRWSREVDAHYEHFEFAKAASRSTTSSGTTSATGTSSWPRCRWPAAASRPRRHPAGARPRAGHRAAAAAPGRAVRHRGAVDGADRRRVARGRALAEADAEPARPGRGGRGRGAAGRGHRGPAVPRPSRGCEPVAAGRRPGWPGSTPTGIAAHEPLVRSLTRLERRPGTVRADGVAVGARRRRVELDLSGAIDVAAERARLTKDLAAAEKELRSADGEARQPGLHREGAGAGGRQGARPAAPRAEADIERITRPARRAARRREHRPAPSRTAADLRAGSLAELRAALAGVPAGPDAGPDRGRCVDLLGDPQRSYPVDPRHRHQRQDDHGADDRRAAARLRSAHRPFHQPAPGRVDRADQPGRASRSATAASSRCTRTSRRTSSWSTDQPRPLSFFEVLTAMAFAAFADAPVDVAVVEVGLGGTWDCDQRRRRPGRRRHADRARPHGVPRRRRSARSRRRRPGSSSRTPSRCWPRSSRRRPPCCCAGRSRSARRWPARACEFGVLRPRGSRSAARC